MAELTLNQRRSELKNLQYDLYPYRDFGPTRGELSRIRTELAQVEAQLGIVKEIERGRRRKASLSRENL